MHRIMLLESLRFSSVGLFDSLFPPSLSFSFFQKDFLLGGKGVGMGLMVGIGIHSMPLLALNQRSAPGLATAEEGRQGVESAPNAERTFPGTF